MITLLLRGGLGNQMFQYGTALSLARRNDAELRLDTVFLKEHLPGKGRTYRDYSLDIFELSNQTRLTLLSQVARVLPLPGIWLGIEFSRLWLRELLGLEKLIRHKNDAFDASVLDQRGNITLFGYWQSENYFLDVEDDLRESFRFIYPLEGEAKQLAMRIQSSSSISIHVRRGDYVLLDMVKTDLSYYTEAVRYISERLDSEPGNPPTLFIFSDDIDWCKVHLKFSYPTVYVDESCAGPKASHHLHLMSLCRHNVIANSTFSWWGAWLNRNPNKIVVTPKEWYAGRPAETIVPERWVKM
jgi:hypothetical protein